MRITFTIAAIFMMALTGFAQNDAKTESTLTSFITYEVPNQVSSTIGDGVIDVLVPQGTNLAELAPSFSLSEGATASINDLAQVSGTVVDFSAGSVTYKVTAADGVTSQNWVATVHIQSGVSIESELAVSIYPNPASEKVTIENAENATVTIYNIIGKEVFRSISNSPEYTVNLNQLSKGTYLVSIQKGNQQVTKKLSVVR
ncbi:MAG: T9SS type A sorting domain-containing protein [Salinivirgaceae bacterium]